MKVSVVEWVELNLMPAKANVPSATGMAQTAANPWQNERLLMNIGLLFSLNGTIYTDTNKFSISIANSSTVFMTPSSEADNLQSIPRGWTLCAMCFPPALRERAWALLHCYAEIAAIPARVTEPMLGHIRYAWWREGIEEIYAGKPARAHPALQALATAIAKDVWPEALLLAVVDAEEKRFEAQTVAGDNAALAAALSTAAAGDKHVLNAVFITRKWLAKHPYPKHHGGLALRLYFRLRAAY